MIANIGHYKRTRGSVHALERPQSVLKTVVCRLSAECFQRKSDHAKGETTGPADLSMIHPVSQKINGARPCVRDRRGGALTTGAASEFQVPTSPHPPLEYPVERAAIRTVCRSTRLDHELRTKLRFKSRKLGCIGGKKWSRTKTTGTHQFRRRVPTKQC